MDNFLLKIPGLPFRAYRVIQPVNYDGLRMSKEGIVLDIEGRILYCDRFPRCYKGDNPTLNIWEYDPDFRSWDTFPEKSRYTNLLFGIWKRCGQKKTQRDENWQALMSHYKKPKKGCPVKPVRDELEYVE